MSPLVHVDGSAGEGGGQVVRTAVAMAALVGRPCRVTAIRAARPRPGLAAQHVAGIRAAAELSGGRVEGATAGSRQIRFEPGPLAGGTLQVDIGTAGAASLVLQVLVPMALGASGPSRIVVTGGTDVAWSPPIDYLDRVHLAWLRSLGAEVSLRVEARGFYPRGGGRVLLEASPWRRLRSALGAGRCDATTVVDRADAAGAGGPADSVDPIDRIGPIDLVERPGEPRLELVSVATRDLERARVAERQVEGFLRSWDAARTASSPSPGELPSAAASAEIAYVDSPSTGTVIVATLAGDGWVLGGSQLGARGKRAEEVGSEACMELTAAWCDGAPLDRWMIDQSIPYLGLLGGRLRVDALSLHARTSMHVVERFLPVRFIEDSALLKAE